MATCLPENWQFHRFFYSCLKFLPLLMVIFH